MALDDFCFEGNPVPGVLVGVMEEKNWSNGVMGKPQAFKSLSF
jgi:hypothetical protein